MDSSNKAEQNKQNKLDKQAPKLTRATLDKAPVDVASMFDTVSKNYDLTNTVLSLGIDNYWRKRTRERLDLQAGDKVLDLAAGTAVSTVQLARSGAWCVACDF